MNKRDYELLSAYIDDALSRAEQAALEARLAAEPDLQQELDSLRQTVNLLWQMPERRAPRDFILTPDMVASRPSTRPVLPFPLTATFSALSTAAAILLFIFGGYFLMQSASLTGSPNAIEVPQAAPAQSIAMATAQPTRIAGVPTLPPWLSPTVHVEADALRAAPASPTAVPTQTPGESDTEAPLDKAAQTFGEQPAPFAGLLTAPADTDDTQTSESDEGSAEGKASQTYYPDAAAAPGQPEEDGAEAPGMTEPLGQLSLEAAADTSASGAGAISAATAVPRAPLMIATDSAIFATMQAGYSAVTAAPTVVLATAEPEIAIQNAAGEERANRQEQSPSTTATAPPASTAPGIDLVGVGLLVIGAFLLGAAAATTLIRRRRLGS